MICSTDAVYSVVNKSSLNVIEIQYSSVEFQSYVISLVEKLETKFSAQMKV